MRILDTNRELRECEGRMAVCPGSIPVSGTPRKDVAMAAILTSRLTPAVWMILLMAVAVVAAVATARHGAPAVHHLGMMHNPQIVNHDN